MLFAVLEAYRGRYRQAAFITVGSSKAATSFVSRPQVGPANGNRADALISLPRAAESRNRVWISKTW